MRIDPDHGAPSLPENTRTASQNPSNPANGSASAGDPLGKDQAQLSGSHVQVQALAAQAIQLPEVRTERVSALRQAVLGGSYHPDTKEVASAIVSHLLAERAA